MPDIIKNSRETIRITRGEFKGHDMVNIRVFYDAGEGDLKPGKQGVAFRAALLRDFLEALNALTGRFLVSIPKHIPGSIKRVSRAIGYAAWLDDTDSWLGLPVVLVARLTTRQRAALAFVTLKSLNHQTACAAANAALSAPEQQEEAA